MPSNPCSSIRCLKTLYFGNLKRLFGPWKHNSFLRKAFSYQLKWEDCLHNTVPQNVQKISYHFNSLTSYNFNASGIIKSLSVFPLPPVNFNFLFLILDENHYLEMSFMRVLKCMSKSNYSIKWKASKDQVSFYLKIFYNHFCLVILPLFPVKTGSKKEFEENFKHLLIKTQQRKHELHLVLETISQHRFYFEFV